MGFFVSAQQERAFSRMGLGLNAPSALSVVVMTVDRMQMLLSKNTALFARRFA